MKTTLVKKASVGQSVIFDAIARIEDRQVELDNKLTQQERWIEDRCNGRWGYDARLDAIEDKKGYTDVKVMDILMYVAYALLIIGLILTLVKQLKKSSE